MNGSEKFVLNNEELEFGIIDLWKYKYSNIYNLQEVIAEFVIEKALGLEKSYNSDSWTLFDIFYKNKRIEIKATSYYHPWNEGGKISDKRVFGITKANNENKFERQNDIYIFCLNNGITKETSNPLVLNNWEFYIVPTFIINEKCGDNKTINLNKVRNIAEKVEYIDIKNYIDNLIDNNLI